MTFDDPFRLVVFDGTAVATERVQLFSLWPVRVSWDEFNVTARRL